MTVPDTGPVLVTGASGGLGRLVVERLLDLGAPSIVAATRDPSRLLDLAARGVDVRAADFDQPATLPAAFTGAQRALIISTDAFDGTDRRVRQHRAAIAAAADSGVSHVLYTSFVNPRDTNPAAVVPDHRATEDALAASNLRWTALRNSIYSEIALLALPPALASGTLYAAAAGGRVAYVTKADCAYAAAAALVAADLAGGPIDVTGPAPVSHDELAAIASEVSGRPLRYVPVEAEDAVRGMVAAGMPEAVARLFVSFDVATANGELDVASTAVADLTGREPESMESFLRAHKRVLDA